VPPDRADEINGLGETLTALTGQVSGLEQRISALESRPLAPSGGGVPAAELEELRRALEAQRAEIEAQSTEIEALSAEAQARESAAQQGAIATLRRAAMTRILTALDSGSDFAPALADLRGTGADVPDALADVADTGVPTRSGGGADRKRSGHGGHRQFLQKSTWRAVSFAARRG
jgi:small-conductance mechanosensitive channel